MSSASVAGVRTVPSRDVLRRMKTGDEVQLYQVRMLQTRFPCHASCIRLPISSFSMQHLKCTWQ